MNKSLIGWISYPHQSLKQCHLTHSHSLNLVSAVSRQSLSCWISYPVVYPVSLFLVGSRIPPSMPPINVTTLVPDGRLFNCLLRIILSENTAILQMSY